MRSEQFLCECLEVAKYDLSCSLEAMIARGPGTALSWFGGMYAMDFIELLCAITTATAESAMGVSDETLRKTTLGQVAPRMLSFSQAHATDGDLGWYGDFSAEYPPSAENLRLRKILFSAEAKDPETLRQLVNLAGLRKQGSAKKCE